MSNRMFQYFTAKCRRECDISAKMCPWCEYHRLIFIMILIPSYLPIHCFIFSLSPPIIRFILIVNGLTFNELQLDNHNCFIIY